jgi:hypothetical protein
MYSHNRSGGGGLGAASFISTTRTLVETVPESLVLLGQCFCCIQFLLAPNRSIRSVVCSVQPLSEFFTVIIIMIMMVHFFD